MMVIYYLFIVFLLAALFPLMAAIWLLKIILDGSPVIFVQERVGLRGKPFLLYKFRTMVNGAEKLQDKYKKLNEAKGPVFKIRNDPRFTPFGRFLSHTGLDELPQLFNVLFGEMSLIGPRPLPVAEATRLKPWMQKRHEILPGIISPWILNGYHKQTFADWMKSDLDYAQNKSLLTDLGITVKSTKFLARLMLREIKESVFQMV